MLCIFMFARKIIALFCVSIITGGVVAYGGVFSPYMIIGHHVIENDDFSFNITYHGGFFEVR